MAEHGSMVAAARALRVAQPSLSRQIGALERYVGVRLFDRTRRGIRLTPPGRMLRTGASAIDARLAVALRHTRLAHEGKFGCIRIGVSRGALGSSRVGRAIASLRRRLPDVVLKITEVGSATHAELLLAGDIDIAIGVYSPADRPRGIRRDPFYTDAVECVLLPATHPLANAASIQPSQLRGERLMMIDPAIPRGLPEIHEALHVLHENGPFETYASVDSIFSLVAAGRGWTPTLAAADGQAPSGTVAVRLEGLHVDLVMGVSWSAGGRSRLVANVVDALRECGRENGSHPASSSETRGSELDVRVPLGLESRHLRALSVTVAEGSVPRAANRLGLTTSGLSRQLRSLELDVGTPLFDRGAGGTAANEAGRAFGAEAAGILLLIDDMLVQVRAAQRGDRNACRIGAVPPEMTGGIVLGAVRYLERHCPDVTIEIDDMMAPAQISALMSRRIDVGVAGAYPGTVDYPHIESVRVGDDCMECALISSNHPLASRSQLGPADLADLPFYFIARATHPGLYDTVMSAFRRIGLVPRIEGSFTGPRTVWRLVADSMGWTVGSCHQRTNPPAGLVAVPVDGLRIPAGIQLLWRRDEIDPGIKRVLDAFRRSGVGVSSSS